MGYCSQFSRATSPAAVLFALILTSSLNVSGQTSSGGVTANSKATSKPSLEKKFLVNILHDQGAIWTFPLHLHRTDAKWVVPLGGSTAALIATDRRTSAELVENGDNLSRLRISHYISRVGSTAATAGVVAGFYLTGRAIHNDHLRETGLLGAEALIDSGILVNVWKEVSQRQRPTANQSRGEFFEGGDAFPSGHSSSAWSVATVIAQEYGHRRPLVQLGAYGLAAAVSVSRYTGRNHFLSDVLVGSAMGYGIGRYVYHKRHDPALDEANVKPRDSSARSKLIPNFTPLYYPRARLYGAMVKWDF